MPGTAFALTTLAIATRYLSSLYSTLSYHGVIGNEQPSYLVSRSQEQTAKSRKDVKDVTAALLVTALALFGALIGALIILIAGIHSDDNAKSLKNAPRSHVEAATRRLLGVGVRTPDSNKSGEE